MGQIAIPAYWMRGGTSKGLFFLDKDLPPPGPDRDKLLLAAIGSPDPYGKQIDGLGGATSSTSKIVVISPSERNDCDVNYLFGHVPINGDVIDYSGNCGNLASAVGLFAIYQGLARASTGECVCVRVWQQNLRQMLNVHVPIDAQGNVEVCGDHLIAGVPNRAPRVTVDFMSPGDPETGVVLPTGNPVDTLKIKSLGEIEASLIYAGNASVFIRAEVLGLHGGELPSMLDSNPALLKEIETIRCEAAVMMGLAESAEQAQRERPSTPKLAFVSCPQDYTSTAGDQLRAEDMDLCARIASMGRMHHAYTGTGAISTAVAAAIPGTIVHECISESCDQSQGIRIGHSAGTMEVTAAVLHRDGQWKAIKASLQRSARLLMKGEVFIPLC